MILNAANITKAFGSESILTDASFLVNEHDKLAVVGVNGAGKTTLLNILSGEDTEHTGTVSLKKDATIGYLHQLHNLSSELSIEDELLKVIKPVLDIKDRIDSLHNQIENASSDTLDDLYNEYNNLMNKYELMDGYSAKSRVYGTIKGLGFSDEDIKKPISSLSGGQKTRVYLAKLLLSMPDIIMLDEPTNHLDLKSIEWLENYLSSYKSAVIIVSHDRYFLDKIVNKVVEIDRAKVTTYEGNYSDYAAKKAAKRQAELKAYENQQRDIKHQEAVIEKLKSYNREKSIKRAESRQKLLSKIDRLEKPTDISSDMQLSFKQSSISGMDVLSVKDLSMGFDRNMLFENLSFDIKRGEHIAIIGDNATGKTTLLKLLTGMYSPISGDISYGAGVMIGYYDQEQQVLDDNKTIFDELHDTYPDMDNTKIRNILAAFLFTGDDVFKLISSLSGGERGRVSLAKLMLSNANFIILDEPTNHLDMISKEILEAAINKYEGTVLYVSHDRYFINSTATRILHLQDNRLYNYIGNYDYYLEKKEVLEGSLAASTDKRKESSSMQDWKAAKKEAASNKKKQKELSDCEAKISELEDKLKDIDRQFEDKAVQCDAARLSELQKEKDTLEASLNEMYIKWEELADE